MSKTVHISSANQFDQLLSTSRIVVTDFYADWCGPCKAIAPKFEELSAKLSRPKNVTFAKVNTDQQQEVARKYSITSLPTFMVFKNKQAVTTIQGANPQKLQQAINKIAQEADSDGGSSTSGFGWTGLSLPKGYGDVTDQVDVLGLDLLNSDSDYGNARTFFDGSSPSTLQVGKGKGKEETKKDWVQSDTDEQLMLFIPFQSKLKIHTLHLTSLVPSDQTNNEAPMRPKTVQLYTNRAQILGFEEAEDIEATQAVTLNPQDWDEKTGTAKIELRFVKFQNISSLVVFVVDGEGDSEAVRIDRIRIVGETGEKRELGKLEKIGDLSGE